jgi:ring-1,2-phenylacetyl-CoA epoxidase subunit PaaE
MTAAPPPPAAAPGAVPPAVAAGTTPGAASPPAAAPLGAAPPRFHWLTVAAVQQETRDAITVGFAVPPALAAAYAFRAGQYLTLRATIGGEEVRRSYSICAGEDEGVLRIAIKRVADGVFSGWAQQTLRPGVAIEVMTPTGRFGIPAAPPGPRVHVAIAAGSGITPVLAILRTVLALEPDSRFFLLYGSRASDEIMFRATLEDLKDRHLGRLSVFHVLSREQRDVDVLNGRLDAAKLHVLLPRLLGGVAIDHAYVCGPHAMIEAATVALLACGVAPDAVHVERFTSVLEGRPRPPAPPPAADAPPFATAVVIADGKRTELPVAAGEAVLDAAVRAGLDLPFSCKGGMCSTCRARLLEGSVSMTVNYALEPWETAAGFVLTCQSRPTSKRVVIDYDRQ